jgi:hypothetical protein
MLEIWYALRGERFDVILRATLPAGVSRWLKMDLPSRAETFGLPVSHVVSSVERRGVR